ncbi:2-succinyl-5-enolpyruvyl-6-hydroxy-3-cyclohexene-1-carboxylate synthase [Corynebacterium anserum]|uniref:2-succinyl-5-enolpyruvyl-6-hydroxy-3-cyclohexene-1-carboxylate synthase n=1 Tax=Corynebacterium anserum TaxID=2684406 RepID=A0A7G7YRB0_9CORY|nr:thiamine pyrophosphate-binding protein [Corynebacterium anserum]QNH97030.1 2-succinyl-5-enolpyruvyl-6-hydroxy-3-cyclohexene-1-carboxylic-acid synthase [Corynebacterium anserum]
MEANTQPDSTNLSPAVVASVLIVDELINGGVREAVVCPGSRSAPLALAFIEAERAGRLRVHVRTDERTGAFLALGLAKATGRIVPVVMTSGTAVANCLPAMVEASLSHVPVMVLSANRPLFMAGTGANQTIEQSEIFGTHSVHAASLGNLAGAAETLEAAQVATVSGADVDHAAVRNVIARAMNAASDPMRGGGVHVDVPLSEPLVPDSMDELSLFAQEVAQAGGDSAAATGNLEGGDCATGNLEGGDCATGNLEGGDCATRNLEGGDCAAKSSDPSETPRPVFSRPLPFGKVTVDLSKRTLVICGAVADMAWAREIIEELAGVPTLAEPLAPVPDFPVHPAGSPMFTAGAVSQGEYSAATQPEQIVVVGRPTLHRSVSQLLADESIHVIVLADTYSVLDVTGNVAVVGSTVDVVGEHPAGWTKVCQAISDMGVDAVRDVLTSSDEHFTGLHVAAVVADSLRDGDALVLGASTAIRDAARAGLPFHGVRTEANRGAAGIDGTISTAIGVAMAHAAEDPTAIRAPRTVALMGDLTFLHDVNALNIGPMETRPDNLLIVVTNDAGGAIFESLEPGDARLRTFGDGTSAFERVFGTPVEVNVEALCEGFGVNYRRAESVIALHDILADHEEQPAPGITVVEAAVERAWRRKMEKTIAQAVTPS